MTVITVENMHCGRCVTRIDRALTAEVISHDVSLERHEVKLEDASRLEAALELLDELGFEAKQK